MQACKKTPTNVDSTYKNTIISGGAFRHTRVKRDEATGAGVKKNISYVLPGRTFGLSFLTNHNNTNVYVFAKQQRAAATTPVQRRLHHGTTKALLSQQNHLATTRQQLQQQQQQHVYVRTLCFRCAVDEKNKVALNNATRGRTTGAALGNANTAKGLPLPTPSAAPLLNRGPNVSQPTYRLSPIPRALPCLVRVRAGHKEVRDRCPLGRPVLVQARALAV